MASRADDHAKDRESTAELETPRSLARPEYAILDYPNLLLGLCYSLHPDDEVTGCYFACFVFEHLVWPAGNF